MKIHTNNFKKNICKMGRQLDSKIIYPSLSGTVELGGNELNSITPHYEGGILKSVMRGLTIDSNVEIPKGTTLNYQFGVLVNGSFEYINFGNYIVDTVEKQEDTNSYLIECCDSMLYAMKDYEALDITYPITVRSYINAICNKIGLTFKNANDTFANYDKEIPSELYSDIGYTYRNVLDELAQVTASTICINEVDDELEIRYINDTKSDNYYNYKDTRAITNGWSTDEDGWINLYYDNTSSSTTKYANYYTNIMQLEPNKEYILVIEIEKFENIGMTFNQSRNDEQFVSITSIARRTPPGIYTRLATTKSNFNNVVFGLRMFANISANVLAQARVRISVLEDTSVDINNFKFHPFGIDTIDEEYLKDVNVNFGEKYGPVNSIVLTRAGGSDSVYLKDQESIDENGLCELKIEDNQIMNLNDRADYLPDILEVLDGFEYYTNDFSSTGICYYNLCDRYNVQIADKNYSCIMFNDEVDVTQGLEEFIHTNMPEESETEYKYASKDDRQRNQAYIIAKKNEAEINALASKIVDVSNTISGVRQIQLENAYEGILHRLEITGNLSATFPSNDLYPNDYLYPSICGIWVYSVKQGSIDWENSKYYVLDFLQLNYINDSVHDTYVYEDGKQWVERNVGIDEFGNKYALSETVIEEGKDIEIRVEKESYITMYPFGDYDNAMFKCTYLLENEYTNTFANQVEVTSELNLLGDELEAKVSSVADEDGNVTSASLILAINKDESGATLNADKVNIEANDVLNILAGNEINMTTKNLSINSDNFSVDSEGNTTMRNANITGGSIGLTGDETLPKFTITNSNVTDRYTEFTPSNIRMWRNGLASLTFGNLLTTPIIQGVNINNNDERFYLSTIEIHIKDSLQRTTIQPSGITTPTLTQTSKEEYKKNFEKLKNAKEILKNTDIYKYNLKSDEDTDKKHIGFVIGDKFNYSEEITSKDNDGVDIYAMVSVLWQVVKEQEEEIKQLKERIDK